MNIILNGKSVDVEKGELLIDVIRRHGIYVPTLCNVEGLSPNGACRMCVVEEVNSGRLVTSCSTEVQDGMDIRTHSPSVLLARKTILELLLVNHPDDCLYCDKNETCELRQLAYELGVRSRRIGGKKYDYMIDASSVSITRDPSKCILCGRCVRVCDEIQGVSAIDFVRRGSSAMVATAFDQGLNVSSCVNCGQCVRVCPTGALTESSSTREVVNALLAPDLHVVVQYAPAVPVTIGECFGYTSGTDVFGKMNAAMRLLGFDKVFSTAFSADLTVMEEASELVSRINNNKVLPMMTSCSPAWIKYVEQFYPDFIPNLSTCKSPQQMMGAVIKSYYARMNNIDPEKIYVVSVMPCTAKKYEAKRPEMLNRNIADVDAVITTRELVSLLKQYNIRFDLLEPEEADEPFGYRSSAGRIFAVTGGVAEAAVRTAYKLITGKELKDPEIKPLRYLEGVKSSQFNIEGLKINVAVVSGLGNARYLLDNIRDKKLDYHFIEVMSCPGGCINGGGQPYGLDSDRIKARMESLYRIDGASDLRTSHNNRFIEKIYKEFLGKPLGEKSHQLLHTHYKKKDTNI
ncbi:MAG: iron hydrogenase small subunit [Oligoflexia bacterium]|nr:iron hydrogenase small subunit [Oligoflexia bacterium]